MGTGEGEERARGELGWEEGMECRNLLDFREPNRYAPKRGNHTGPTHPADKLGASNNSQIFPMSILSSGLVTRESSD